MSCKDVNKIDACQLVGKGMLCKPGIFASSRYGKVEVGRININNGLISVGNPSNVCINYSQENTRKLVKNSLINGLNVSMVAKVPNGNYPIHAKIKDCGDGEKRISEIKIKFD